MASVYPAYNIDKIYLDAYQQVSAAGGERYPAANEAINNRMFSGTLIMNYTGHGSEQSWAKERVLTESDISTWTNLDKLTPVHHGHMLVQPLRQSPRYLSGRADSAAARWREPSP
jgi:hypothetical protein